MELPELRAAHRGEAGYLLRLRLPPSARAIGSGELGDHLDRFGNYDDLGAWVLRIVRCGFWATGGDGGSSIADPQGNRNGDDHFGVLFCSWGCCDLCRIIFEEEPISVAGSFHEPESCFRARLTLSGWATH